LGAQALKQPTLEADRLEDVLDTLAEHAQNIQMVVVLGEYPRLREVVPECDKRLQEVVDRWRGQSKFKLVLTDHVRHEGPDKAHESVLRPFLFDHEA
jgi:pantothenate kinase type III